MQPGEEVVFSYKDFYGASENVTLEKEISLRLSTLLLGRWVWHFARCHQGEGILLLKAHVQHVDEQRVSAVPRAMIVAFEQRPQVGQGRTAEDLVVAVAGVERIDHIELVSKKQSFDRLTLDAPLITALGLPPWGATTWPWTLVGTPPIW